MSDIQLHKKLADKYYAVVQGSSCGIFDHWDICQPSVKGYSGAKYRGFESLNNAVEFMNVANYKHESINIFTKDDPSNHTSLVDYCQKHGITIPPPCKPQTRKSTRNSVQPSTVIPIVNVDGACLNNGQCDAIGGYGVFWGPNDSRNCSSPLPRDNHLPTNNRAELYAAIIALEQAVNANIPSICIRSDSDYLVQGISCHLVEWMKSPEFDTRKNHDLWLRLSALCEKIDVNWVHVKGHSGDAGNEAADSLANKGASQYMLDVQPPPDIIDDRDPLVVQPCFSPTGNQDKTVKTISSCSHCEREDSDEMIACDRCGNWLHYSCSNLPPCQLFLLCSSSRTFHCTDCIIVPVDFKDKISKCSIASNHSTTILNFQGSDVATQTIQMQYSDASVGSNVEFLSCSTATVTEELSPPRTNTEDCMSNNTLLNTLNEAVNQLKSVTDFQSAIRDVESKLVERLVQSTHENSRLRNEVCSNELSNAKKDNQDLRKELGTKSKRIEELETLVTSLTSDIVNFLKANKCESCTELKMLLSERESLCQTLQADKLTLTNEIFSLRNINKTLEHDHVKESTLITTHKKDLEETRQILDATSSQIAMLHESISSAHSKVDSLRSDMVHKSAKSDNMLGSPSRASVRQSSNRNTVNLVHQNQFDVLDLDDNGSKLDAAARPTNKPKINKLKPATSKPKSYPTVGPNHTDNGRNQRSSRNVHSSGANSSNADDLDVLIIGNSHVKYIDPTKMYKFKNCHVVSLLDKTLEGAQNHVKSSVVKTKCVVLHAADNNLSFGTLAACKEATSDLVDLCKHHYPGAEICVSEALPRRLSSYDKSEAYNTKALHYNEFLHTLGVNIIYQDSLRSMNNSLYVSDGVHLTKFGLAQFIRNFKSQLNPILGLKSYSEYNVQDSRVNHQRPVRSNHRASNSSDSRPIKPHWTNSEPVQPSTSDNSDLGLTSLFRGLIHAYQSRKK